MRYTWIGFIIGALAACPGKAPPDQNNPDGAVDGDGSNAVQSVAVSGKVIDYFTGTALDTTAITTDGLVPAAATTSGADGAYTFDAAVGSKLFALASRASYRATRSAVISVTDQPLAQDIYIAGSGDVTRQFSTVGVTQTTGTIVAAEVQKNNGAPFEGLALTAFTLTDLADAAVPGISGPYFFGTLGDLDVAVTTSTAYGTPPRVRVAFLNVPTGTYNLKVAFIDGMGNPKTNVTPIVIDAGGATLALNGGASGSAAATLPADPTFATDIYPVLQTAAKGGLGCANCHTANGPTGAKDLVYDGPAQTVLDGIKAATGVIDATTPANSLLLTMPLYELAPPQNHPNATFLTTTDPYYKLLMLWITNGAKP